MWRLRLKQAQDRGAYLVVANARHTRLEDFALDGTRYDKVVVGDAIRYAAGDAPAVMRDLHEREPDIAKRLAEAENLVIVTGAEGLDLEGSDALATAAAQFLNDSGHVGKRNKGLLCALPGANGMGLYYLGFTPQTALDIMANPPRVLIIAGVEALDDDPNAREWLGRVETVIYANLFDDGSSEFADFMLPLQSFAERDGSFVNGERRAQRFYVAQGPMGDSLPAWKLFGGVRQALGQARVKPSAGAVMLEISQSVEAFAGITYKGLAQVRRQFPDVGGRDLYYGGTAYNNQGGLGIQIPAAADHGEVALPESDHSGDIALDQDDLLIMPITRLYNRQRRFRPSLLMEARILHASAIINPTDAAERGIVDGDMLEISGGGSHLKLPAEVSDEIAPGAVAVPRHLTDDPAPLHACAGSVARARQSVAVGD